MFYTVKMPWIVRKLYPTLTWEKPTNEKIIYLTFDDGPHPAATNFILDQLNNFNAKATFFCIGKNVIEYPTIYKRIIEEGHKVGNHTFNHLNGWKTSNEKYIADIYKASQYIDSNLFRPPYGRMTKFQIDILQKQETEKKEVFTEQRQRFDIIMWSVLSGDFDEKLSPGNCLQHVLLNAKPGSIVVFHDSAKAWDRVCFALPKVLEHFTKEGFTFRALM